MKEKPKILIICNYYLPGYEGGGSLRTIVNTVERLHNKFDFRIITRDHDGDNIPFKDVKINEWNTLSNSQVFYLSRDSIKISKLRELIAEVKPNSIYINSVFATLSIYVLLLKRFAMLSGINVILAPEGEISDGALKLKAGKKKIFLKAAQLSGLHKNLIWKTTSEFEKSEVERIKGQGGTIFIAPNLTSRILLAEYQQKCKPRKSVGAVKMIFLSRFVPKKNFNWLFRILSNIEGNLTIDIYGNLEDKLYWAETEKAVKELPPNISVNYCGSIPHEQVTRTIFNYHFFLLPTLGENFGHVFIEALAAGCPLLISDRTPWRDLDEKQIGWDIPLENQEKWRKKINDCITLDDETYSNMSASARNFSVKWLNDIEIEMQTRRVLETGL